MPARARLATLALLLVAALPAQAQQLGGLGRFLFKPKP